MLWSVEPHCAKDIESLAKRFQGICLSEVSLFSALLVEIPFGGRATYDWAGLYSFNIKLETDRITRGIPEPRGIQST